MIQSPGIYKLQSKIKPERFYIGSAVNIRNRVYRHKWGVLHNEHDSPKLQRHCNKYGWDDIVISVVEECDILSLIDRENYYIQLLEPYFNCCPYAGNSLGYKHTEETKRKISELQKGKKLSPERVQWMRENSTVKGKPLSLEHREKISKANKGRKCSPEAIEKTRQKLIGRKHSDEHRKKNSEATKGSKNHFFGKKHSEESKAKMSLGHSGQHAGNRNPAAKIIINLQTGVFYGCMIEAYSSVGNVVSLSSFRRMMSGKVKNKTNLIYA